MTHWRQSAALRISLAWSAGFALGMVVLGAIVFLAMHFAFMRQMDGILTQEAQSLAGRYHTEGLKELREAITDRAAIRVPTRPMYALYTASGKRIAGDLDAARPGDGFSDIIFHDPAEGDDWARAYAIDLSPTLRMVVAEDREWLERIDGTIITVFAAAFAALVAFGVLAAFLFAGYLRRRLEGFRASAQQVIAGRIEDRMPVSPRGDEFDELAATLNAMLERIERLVGNLRQVSNDIAHDLRTPLSRLRQKLEVAIGDARGTPAEAGVAEAFEQTDAVLALFASILHLSEVERGGNLPLADIDLSELARDVAESYEPSVGECGRTLGWQIDPAVVVHGNRSLIAQALSNLVENAQKHTPPRTRVTIRLAADQDTVRLSVCDDGPGIAHEDRARAVRRFERLDSARSRPGFGLGLALVDAVARRLSGRLELSDAAPGLCATIVLPRAS
ncbi:MAG: HAMP domain-containing histidine kinase [Sphingomonadales bacterium]|nr:HAMP domain-containing histidine kinase [Sphingomonadales bacterium]MDE2568388.1 HAMP domain-containing histidine kinase [Sphingomonadales bacterium]